MNLVRLVEDDLDDMEAEFHNDKLGWKLAMFDGAVKHVLDAPNGHIYSHVVTGHAVAIILILPDGDPFPKTSDIKDKYSRLFKIMGREKIDHDEKEYVFQFRDHLDMAEIAFFSKHLDNLVNSK